MVSGVRSGGGYSGDISGDEYYGGDGFIAGCGFGDDDGAKNLMKSRVS